MEKERDTLCVCVCVCVWPQGLHVVAELQMKINESNSVLVFLHETLKLARKR